jgi:hypothetical protein
MVAGRLLRFEVLAPRLVRCSLDGWRTTIDLQARETGLGVWIADVPGSDKLAAGTAVDATFYWSDADRRETGTSGSPSWRKRRNSALCRISRCRGFESRPPLHSFDLAL